MSDPVPRVLRDTCFGGWLHSTADGSRADTCGHSPTDGQFPMTLRQSLLLTALAAVLAALSACGGGGGGGGGGGNAAPDDAIAQITPPDYTNDTGLLAAPTKVIDFNAGPQSQLDQLATFIRDLQEALAVAPLGQAAAAFAAADDDGNGPISGGQYLSCPAHLTITGSTYTFSGCVIDGYQVDGQATLSAVGASTYTLTFSGISVTLPSSSPIAISGSADCTVTVGAVPKCVVQLGPISPLSTHTYRFGWNADYAGGVASGTHSCGCTETWLVTLDNFTATSGTALIQASNGSALIRRDSANLWDVELTPTGGQTIVFPNITTTN
jgi:hypothetical protein